MKKTFVGYVEPWYATHGKDKWGYNYWPKDKRGGSINLPHHIYINKDKSGNGDDYLKITITVEIEEAPQESKEAANTSANTQNTPAGN
jgi:hypothetical protein